jgi:hypothetical protein
MPHLESSSVRHADRKWPERLLVKRRAELLDGHKAILAGNGPFFSTTRTSGTASHNARTEFG